MVRRLAKAALVFLACLVAPAASADEMLRALGTVVPASDEDLNALRRAAGKLSANNEVCKSGKDQNQCVLADCGAGGDAARRLDETLALLEGMEPHLTTARHAAFAHFKTLMDESIRKGNRQAELEKYHAYAKFLQDFGKLMLTAADLVDFAKNLRGNIEELEQFLADPGGGQAWKILAKADFADSIVGAVQNTADMADGVAQQYRENGLGIPEAVQKASTVKQGLSDAKNAARAYAEGYAFVKQAEAWRRYATTLTDATEKARILEEAKGFTSQAKEKFSGMRAALGQLIGKILVAVSESQLADMQEEIKEIESNLAAEEIAIHNAWLDWNRLARRSDALDAAIADLKAARGGMNVCLDGCPAQPASPPPSPPSFKGPDGKDSWGAALKWYRDQIAQAGAALSGAAFAFDTGAMPNLAPVMTPQSAGDQDAGRSIEFAYDVDQCTANDGEASTGEASAPFGGAANGVVTLPVPSTAGPVRIIVRRPGKPDVAVETPVVSRGGPKPATADGGDPCGPINCDCDNLEFGLLTGEYRRECRAAEAALKAQCAQTKRIEGTCHPTASGPNPYP